MNANGQDPNKSRRIKTIIATVIAGVIVIFVGFWAISSAINSGKKAADNNNAKTTETAKTTEKEKTETTGSKPTSPSSQYTSTTQTTTTPAPAVTVTESPIPTTGPSEVVFSAIMLGVVASLAVLNIQLVKARE